MLKKDLQTWFKERPSISIRQFAMECGYRGDGYFQRWLTTPTPPDKPVSKTIHRKIIKNLRKYGYEDKE
jgi:hypothetical protein